MSESIKLSDAEYQQFLKWKMENTQLSVSTEEYGKFKKSLEPKPLCVENLGMFHLNKDILESTLESGLFYEINEYSRKLTLTIIDLNKLKTFSNYMKKSIDYSFSPPDCRHKVLQCAIFNCFFESKIIKDRFYDIIRKWDTDNQQNTFMDILTNYINSPNFDKDLKLVLKHNTIYSELSNILFRLATP